MSTVLSQQRDDWSVELTFLPLSPFSAPHPPPLLHRFTVPSFPLLPFLSQVRKHITDLYEDLRDGHNLISLLEVLSGVTLVGIFISLSHTHLHKHTILS